MDKALLLHWWWWNSSGNWFPYLQGELNKRLFDVYTPNLPHTDTPILEEQLEYIDIYNSDFKDWWFIVWHSLWCQLSLKFVEENNIRNSIIILVAPSYPWLALELGNAILWNTYNIIERYYNTNINFNKLNKLNNKYYIFLSDDDPYINMENAKKYYSNLSGVKFTDFKNMWHFNKIAWVTELKEILEYIN